MRTLKIFLCLVPSILWGQNAFIKTYGRSDYGNYVSSQITSVLNQDSKIYLLGAVQNGGNNQPQQPLFTSINFNGQIDALSIDSNFYNAQFRASVYQDGFIYVAGHRFEPQFPYVEKIKTIRKLDLNGDIIWSKTFGQPAELYFDNIVDRIYKKDDKIIVIATGSDGSEVTKTDFTILNSEGEVLLTKLFEVDDNLSFESLPIASAQTDDGYLLMLRGYYGPAVIPDEPEVLIKLDQLGNEKWRISLGEVLLPEKEIGDSLQTVSTIIGLKNNHFAIIFQTVRYDKEIDLMVTNKRIIVEFDENGNYLKSNNFLDEIDYVHPQKLCVNKQGDLFLFGTSTDSGGLWDPFALKFDEDFNIAWYNQYGYEDGERLQVADVTSDGGVVLVGNRVRWSHPAGSDYFIAKTDCNGNLEWDNQSCVVSSEEEVIVFGNPVQDEWLMHFPQLNADDVVEYELVNSIGQIVLQGVSQGPIFNETISNLSVGMYAFRLQFAGGKSYVGKVMKY